MINKPYQILNFLNWLKKFTSKCKFPKSFKFNKLCSLSSIFYWLFGFRIDNYWECGSHKTEWEHDNDVTSPIYKNLYPDFIKSGDDLKNFINSPYYWYNYFKIEFKDKNLDSDEKLKIVNQFILFKCLALQSDSNEFYLEMLQDLYGKQNYRNYKRDFKNSVFSKEIDLSNIPHIFTDLKVLEDNFLENSEPSHYSIESFPSSIYSPKSSQLGDNADNFPAGWDAFEFYKYNRQRKKIN